MARRGRTREQQPLPPPLPPETRTIGQLVAETVRFYRNNLWRTLPLGLPVAVVTQVSIEVGRGARLTHERANELLLEEGATPQEAVRFANVLVDRGVREAGDAALRALVTTGLGSVLLTLAFVAAAVIVSKKQLDARTGVIAVSAGIMVFIPVQVLAALFILPAIAWLAFIGLVVPAAVIERRGYAESLRRAIALARADYVHALGGLATLVIVYVVTRLALLLALQNAGESTARTAVFLADVVVSPILFVGGVLLYYDQAARVRSRRPARERSGDADLHDADDADRPGAANAAVEPRPAARGEP